MDQISQILFLVSDSLLIPDIIVLLVLFVRALLLVGSFYNQYITKYKNERQLRPILQSLTPESVVELHKVLPKKDNSLFVKYLRKILEHPADDAYTDYMITNFENEAEKDVVTSKLLAKVGPVLGLIGTLIAMSPALTGLSQGDISKMASNMQVVFATTVVGLVVSLVGLITLQLKQRWYAKEVNQLDYITRTYNQQLIEK
ncbi:MotA/TolQ/ExbB proton channel family protein [Capnocytophaga sp. oral taxon 338]|uniref:MotA/TolQ/ExbB proton channel family protein n=1 Tax=Capnocytophaga sp. oral taxon 338 TaxID=710239 RepID=UPI0002E0965C|nr:MotA/TolQ/ExbB proton channel family protein [Capnocytophaga sp. oral taxon 338]